MRKFLLSLFVFGLSLTAAVASRNENQKHFVSVMAEEDPCKMESVKSWKITDFPFLSTVIAVAKPSLESFLTPTDVLWHGIVTEMGNTSDCVSGTPFHIEIDVNATGTAATNGMAAPGVSCRVHIGRVTAFGLPWTCLQDSVMTWSSDNGIFDVYEADILLPPGLWEVTCNCSDDNYATAPANVRWIGDNLVANMFADLQLTVTGGAVNDNCNDPLITLNANTNTVDNFCTVDGTAGFRYVVTNGEFVDLAITTGAGNLLNPAFYNIRLDACANPNVTPPLTCLPIGTVILIEAGQIDGFDPMNACPDYGTFEITITDIDNGVGNDVCIDADAVNNFGGNNILNCGENGGFTGDIDACPDPEETCFGATTEGVWYSFTTANSLTTFSISTIGGGQYELFSGANCGALTSLGCAVTNLPSDPLTTYFLLVGPTGTVTVTAAALPTNDLCAGAIPVTAINNTGLTNECATTDLVTCGAESEATVWYSYVLGATDDEVIITSDLPNSVVRVYNACGGALVTDADGVDCDETATLQCRTPGTYFIQVGSSFVNAGPFSLNITATPNGVVNDACSEATNIPVVNDCTYQPFNTNTTNACPETFSLACNGGNNNTDPTVWLQFTPPVGVTSINIQNITPAGAYLSILTPCGAGATIPNGGCIVGAGPTANITVTGGATYFIAAAIAGNEGQIDFEIRYNDPPVNDVCAAALPVVVGANANLTNVCAQQELTPCGGTLDQASVWYSYNIPTGVESLVINSNLVGGTIQVYEDDCNTILAGTTGGCTSNTVTIDCPEMQSIRIYVSSPSANSGIFTLTLTQTLQSGIDVCATGQNLALAQPLCKSPNVFMSNNTGFCPEPAALNFGGCDFSDGPATWYNFTTSATTTLLDIDVIGLGVDFALFSNCAGTPVASSCTTDGTLANLPVTGSTTYNLVISGAGGAEGPFTIEITEKSNAPTNDICTSPIAVNLGANTNLTNLCANQEQLLCAAPNNEASVWYSYTIPAGVESLTITTNLTGGVVQVLETDCNTVPDGVTNPCTSTVTIDCPVAQEIRIFMSSSVANSGIFTLTLTQTLQSGIDVCASGLPLALTQPLCKSPNVFMSNNTGFCPEPASINFGGCDFSDGPATWYRFTTGATTTLIDIDVLGLNVDFALFTNCVSGPVASSCTTDGSLMDLPVTGSTTYNLVISGQGGAEGPFTIEITEKSNAPVNDICTGALPVNLGGNPNLTNLCANQEQTPCTGTANEASVWYSYTIPAGVESLTINTNLAGGVLQVVEDDCNTLLNGVTGGCTSTLTLNCPVAQDIRIFMSSSVANSGIFTLTLTQVNTSAPNDLCANATDIANNPICEFFTVPTSTTVGACPEQFTVTGCAFDYSTESVVWYEFTPPVGTTSIEIENISANTNLTVFNSCPNPNPGTILAGGGCLSGNGTNGTPILVTAGVTYYVAIGVDGTEGPVDFDIRYNQTLANDNPCVGGFIPTPLTTGVQLTNQNNSCATDDNDCGGAPVENSLWYTFTLGAGFDRITINVTGLTTPSIGVYDVANPCNQTPVNEECNGDGMVDFNCLPAGTYTIFVGTSAANAGVFSITATQGTNAGPVNDFCDDATNLPGQPYILCVELGPFDASTVNACPETLPAGEIFGACDFNVEETSWYTFTAPGNPGDMPTMDFTYTGYTGTGTPFMNVFEFGPDCSALNAVEATCFQGLNTPFNIGPLTPGQQYLIAISSLGDTGGDFDFTVKFNLGPANDDNCADLTNFDLGSGGTLLGQTNLCSGGDYTFTDCPIADYQNSVWYTFTVDPGSYGVIINVDQILNNGTPITGPLTALVMPDGCNSNEIVSSLCFPAKTDQNLDCLEPGTYDLQIASSSVNAGDFTITLSQLVDDRECAADSYDPSLSDDCDDAIVINMAGIVCEDILIKGCNENACPETFNSGACNFGTDPAVWYEFTVDANTAAIDITGLSGGYYFAILTSTACTDEPPTSIGGAGCISAPNTNNIAVTGGETYYLVIADPNGGSYSFNIRQNAYPINDDPNPSSPRPPFDIPIGGGHSSTTCCAIGVNDDPALDFPNVACATTTHDGAVWYTYTTGGEIGIEIQVSASGTNQISGATTVEVLQGTAAGPSATLFDPNSFDCGALPTSIKVGCYEPGEVIWIKVASSNNDCGEFSININPINRCPMADLCEEAVDVIIPNPTDPNCGMVEPVNISGCIENACPEDLVADCGFGMQPTVWFQVMVDAEAVQLQTTVTTNGTWQPVWAIYYGDCMMPTLLGGGGPGQPPVPCSNSDSNPNIHSVGVVVDVDTYWIAVTGEGVIDDPNFTLGVTTLAGCVACIGEAGCEAQAEWEITARSSDRPLDDPKFCQGEEVTVCINFDYDASDTGVDWFHGLIPDFGPGWDLDAFDPEAIVVSPGGAEWADVDGGNCAPLITEQMPFLCTYTDPLTGRLVLCNTGCQACPCSGPLLPNSPLPSGWFWSQNGGAGCENNDCEPYTQYGIGSVVVSINFCVDLTVREFDDPADCIANRSLRFNFQTTSDGVSGCWNDPVAECKLDYAQIGPNWEIDCARPPKILGNDFELCHEGEIDIDLVTEDGSNLTIIVTHIPNPDVTGAMDHVFPGGAGTIDDYLTNTSSSTTIQYYEAYADDPTIACPAPRDTFQVIIYPELIVDLPVLNICFEDTDGETLTPTITGGTGNYVGYQWSTGATSPSIQVFHSGPDMISVTVTDDKGCTGTQVVDVNKLDPLSFTLTPEQITSCANEVVFEATDLVGNGSPLTISWNVPPQLFFFDQGTSLVINLPFSLAGTYQICATLTDEFGCNITKCAELTISVPPTVELGFVTPACGALTTDLLVQNYVTQTGANPTFTLVDCGGSIVYSMNGAGPAYQTTDPNGIFEDVDLSLNNCFQLLVEEEGGCSFLTDQIVVPLTSGTPAQLSAPTSICLGQSTTISVTNAASFPGGTYIWSPTGSGSSFVATPTQTTQYSVTVTNNGCVSVASVLITVNPLPTPGISGATAYCAGESTELTASGGTSYAWSGPGFTGNMASTGPISTAGTYIVTVTNANGCTATSSATISEEAFITVQISPVTICDNSLDSLNAGGGFDSYQWFNNGNLIGTSQYLQVTQAGTYTVSVTDGNCLGGGTGVVINNTTPVLNLPASLTVCRLNTGIGPTTIDFVSIADTMDGQWFNIESANVDVSNWGNVDFTTVQTADTFLFVYIANTAVAPCINPTDTVEVIVRNCACPNPAIRPIGPLCNSSTAPYNLNNTFINQMPPLPGDWTVEAPSPTPFPTITGNTIVVTGATPGTYTVRFTYNPPSPGNCPKFIENTLVVSPAPAISSRNTTLCNADIGAGPVMANLDTLLVGLIEPTPGSWTQIDGATPMGTLPNIDVTGMSRDTLRFQYTTTAVAPCVPRTAIVEVIIRNCECPVVTLANDELCNGSMTLLDLESAANFTIDPTTITGTWTAQAPLTITNGHFINPFGVTASATPYTVTFTLNGTFPADCQTVFTKTVRIRNQPVAEKLNDGEACSASTGNGATDIRLTSLLRPGYTTGGTWTQISPATPQLTIAPTSIVDFNGQVPGTAFVFRYTPPINLPSPCMPVSVDVTVTVKDCNCPDGNIACPGDCDLCNNGGILDLATTIVNPTTFAPGNWSVVTGPNDDEQTLNGTIFDANGLPSGTYTVIYTLVPTPTGGCQRTDEFDIFIANDQKAVIIPDTLVCNGQNGIITFDVGSLKVSGNGSWFDEAGNNITVNTNIDLMGLAPGTVLNFTFESVFTDPCPQNTYPVTIRITDNCNCPPINPGMFSPICTNSNTFDLNPFNDASEPGTWSSTNPALVITNGILNLTGVPAGQYSLTYTINNPVPGCPSSVIRNITISNPKSAGTARGAEFCLGATDIVTLRDRLDNEDAMGTWTVVSGGSTGFNATAGTFNLTGRPAGTYVFKYAFTNQSPCPNDEEEITIRINPLPVADAGTDKNIDCTVQTALLGTDLTSTGTNIVYEWKLLNAIVGTSKNYTALAGGTYVLTVRDTVTNCSSTDNVVVIQADDLPIFDISVDTIACFGEVAQITLSNIRGGQSPYEISFNGGQTYGSALVASNLGAGTYKVQVRDANGCVNDQLPAIVITSPPLFAVNLGQDFFLNITEDSLLSIIGQYDPNTFQSITWAANDVEIVSARDQGSYNAKPEVDTRYRVTVINESGCIATDEVRISIRRVKPECVPNIFSPNESEVNEYFSINCAEVELVTKYSIYDRWGNLLFVGENLSPDNPSSFWDGKFKGQDVVPGVYAYYLEMLFKDGSTEKRGGDVTVIR